jgi:hypothetical protein
MLHSIPEKQEIYGSGRTLEWLLDKVVESQNNGRYAIFGLGGIGKTSIMLEFAIRFKRDILRYLSSGLPQRREQTSRRATWIYSRS